MHPLLKTSSKLRNPQVKHQQKLATNALYLPPLLILFLQAFMNSSQKENVGQDKPFRPLLWHHWSCFYVLISQWIWVGNWEHTEKAKQLSSAAGVELRSLSDRRDSLHKTVGSLTGARDTGRGIVYARRIQEKIGKNKYNFYDVANMCRTPRVPSTLPTTDPQQGYQPAPNITQLCGCTQMAEVCTTNLKVAALLKAFLSIHSTR